MKKFTCHHSKSKTSFHQESHPYRFIPSKPLIYIYTYIYIYRSIKTRNIHPTCQILSCKWSWSIFSSHCLQENISKPLLVPAPIRGTASGFPHMPDSFRDRFFRGKVPPKKGGIPWEVVILFQLHSTHSRDILLTQKRHLNCCVPRILTENLLEHHKEELAAPGRLKELKGFILIIDF